MKTLLCALILAASCQAQGPALCKTGQKQAQLDLYDVCAPAPTPQPSPMLWKGSLAILGVSDALDIRSSYGLQEQNPVLGRGPFGNRQAAASAILTFGAGFGQLAVCHITTCTKKKLIGMSILNLGVSGVHFWLAERQFGMRR